MVMVELPAQLILDLNDISLILALLVSVLFYRQYKKYEEEISREETIEQFLNN
jgi:hypothetical protein